MKKQATSETSAVAATATGSPAVSIPANYPIGYSGILVDMSKFKPVAQMLNREMGRVRKALQEAWPSFPAELKRCIQSSVHGPIEIEKNSQALAYAVQHGVLTPEQKAIADMDRKAVRFMQAAQSLLG